MDKQEEKVYHNIDKLAVKEALQEWLDKKWDETCRNFGKWSIMTLGLLAFGAFVYFILWANGWHK